MKLEVKNLIQETIYFKYTLPNNNINASIYTNNQDYYPDCCYFVKQNENFIDIIYNLILYYSFNEQELVINDINFQNLLVRALNVKIKYNVNDTEKQKLNYGFYGEVLLYGILKVFFGVNALISRGYFYSLGRETTGFDCFHILENNNKVELWFGEAKFYNDYREAIKNIFKPLEKDLSDNYLSDNIKVIFDKSNYGNFFNEKEKNNRIFYDIIEKWKNDSEINLTEELINNNMELVYPVLLIVENTEDYDNKINNIIKYINKQEKNINITIKYSLFFIILPVSNVKLVKEGVLKCIEGKKKLI